MNQPEICVVGACNIDLISYVPRLSRVGETLHGSRFCMGFGGKGANQAVMAAKLGARVTMIGKLGRDVFGENTLQNLQSFGIDTRHVPVDTVAALDSTGAGDAFVGSLAFFLARGLETVDAMERANRIAAISVQAAGTQSSFPAGGELPAELLA